MKTNNYQFDLMQQGQDHKDVLYNEAILKIDALFSINITKFIDLPPKIISYGEKYIIQNGERKNKICYFAHESKGVQYIQPIKNMIVFLINNNCYLKFINNEWQNILPEVLQKFLGINKEFILSGAQDYYFLYLEGNTSIQIDATRSFRLIIKQNYQFIFEIKWPLNILWANNISHVVTNKINMIDGFRMHKLPESNHFLSEIIGQGYSY